MKGKSHGGSGPITRAAAAGKTSKTKHKGSLAPVKAAAAKGGPTATTTRIKTK